MVYPRGIIVLMLHLYVEGLSLSKIREVAHQHHGFRPSDGNILNWGSEVLKARQEIRSRAHAEAKDPW